MRDIIFEQKSLQRLLKKSKEPTITITVGVGQVIRLKDNVLYEWKITEELEGIYTVHSKYHPTTKYNNTAGRYANYLVYKDACGNTVLVRIP